MNKPIKISLQQCIKGISSMMVGGTRWIAFVFMTLVTSYAQASGGDFPDAVFFNKYNPAEPKIFYTGQMGIFLPTYETRHLVVAYRRLEGLDVSSHDEELLSPSPEAVAETQYPEPQVELWKAARASVGLKDVSIVPDISNVDYDYSPNCTADAFRRATGKLKELVEKFGKEDKDVMKWGDGQDAVFSNCSGIGKLPDNSTAGDPAWLQDERDYQVAAALYYRADYEAAAKYFNKLAQRSNNSLSPLAAYLAARSIVRLAITKAGSSEDGKQRIYSEETVKLYKAASLKIDELLVRGEEYPYYLSAMRLRGQLGAALYPHERALYLDQHLLSQHLSENVWQDVIDYTLLAPAWAPEAPIYKWITNLRSEDHADSLTTAKAIWKQTGKPAWLMSVLYHAGTTMGDIDEELHSASLISKASPYYTAANYYRVRALKLRGRKAEAYKLAKQLLAINSLDSSATNLLLDEVAELSPTLDAFVAVALKKPVTIDYPGSENGYAGSQERWIQDPILNWRKEISEGNPRYFSDAVANIINLMPYDTLHDLLKYDWPIYIRQKLTLTVWTRGLLLDKTEKMNDVAQQLQGLFPNSLLLLQDFQKSSNKEERKYLAIVLVLRIPEASVVQYAGLGRDDPPESIGQTAQRWWEVRSICDAEQKVWDFDNDSCNESTVKQIITPAFINQEHRVAGKNELAEMYHKGAMITFAGKIVLSYASQHADDKYLPEALHLVVRASRYGEYDKSTGLYSNRAFTLLNKKYKGTLWQKKTPYWFGDLPDDQKNCP